MRRQVEYHSKPAPFGYIQEQYEHALLAAGGRRRDEFGRNCLVTNEVCISSSGCVVGSGDLPLCVRMPNGWPNPPSTIRVRHIVTGARHDRAEVMRSLLDDVDLRLVHLYRGRRDSAEQRTRCVYEMDEHINVAKGEATYYEWQVFPVVSSESNRYAFDFRGVVRAPARFRWKVQILY